jgi:undecaprenyl diphosphate synthase
MSTAPLHAALIMDGNGRWAQRRGLPRVAGHKKGTEAVRRVVEHAPALGIGTLTLYAFSSDNWTRPGAEVRTLMELFRYTLGSETPRCLAEGVRLTVIGRRDRLGSALISRIQETEHATATGQQLHLRLAVDYSGRQSIAAGEVGPDVDLLVRTGGEQRLSDFLLWESAYAEILFEPRLWPDYTGADLARAVAWFQSRNRRFGGLGQYKLAQERPGNVHQLRGDRWLR